MASISRGDPFHRERLAIAIVLALLTLAAWLLTLSQMSTMAGMSTDRMDTSQHQPAGHAAMEASSMRGMPMEPAAPVRAESAEPGIRLLLHLGMWISMMAAMMLPAAAPIILMFGTVYRREHPQGNALVPTLIFVVGFLTVWAVFGAYVWGFGEIASAFARTNPTLMDLGPRFAAVAMLAAGAYQLTPLKQTSLGHCRSPLQFNPQHWRDGAGGAFRVGFVHGVHCVGCCWMLFLLLAIIGLASVPWMGLITLIVCAEKLLPLGRTVTLAAAVGLFALGLVMFVRPDLLLPTMA